MNLFNKLRRVSSHGYAEYIPGFYKAFPELSKIPNEELNKRWKDLGVMFYTETKEPVPVLTRLTLPFGITIFLLMLIGLPINFLITGNWYYGIGTKSKLYNWFKALKLQ